MKLAELSEVAIAKIKQVRWDRIIEKHEGPENWESVLRYYEPELMEIEGQWVLLPIEGKNHQNVTVLRTIWSESGNSVTLFIKDTTYEDDPFFSGYLAVCDKVKGENFYLTIVYHEWFVIEQEEGILEK